MRGHVRRHGSGWAVVIDLGRAVPCRQCQSCRRRYWLDRRPPKQCTRCGGSLEDANGRRQSWHRGYATEREAEQARTALLSRLDRGGAIAPVRETLGAYLIDEWLPARQATLKPSTFASYTMQASVYVATSPLGSLPLSRVDGPALNRFYAGLLSGG